MEKLRKKINGKTRNCDCFNIRHDRVDTEYDKVVNLSRIKIKI